MSRQAFMRWEKLRLKGRNYVMIRTAFLSGISLFVGLNLIYWFWTGSSISTSFFFLYPALGLVAGIIHWSVNELRFEEFIADKKLRAGARR